MAERHKLTLYPKKLRELLDTQNDDEAVTEFLNRIQELELIVDPNQRGWEFRFHLSNGKSIPKSLPPLLQDYFEDKVSNLKTVKAVTMPHDDESLESWLKKNWTSLKIELKAMSPAGSSALKYARFHEENKQLVVELADEQWINIAREKNLDDAIENWIHDRFGSALPIEFREGDFDRAVENDTEEVERAEQKKLKQRQRRNAVRSQKKNDKIIYGNTIKTDPIAFSELNGKSDETVTIRGKIIKWEFTQTSPNKKNLVVGIISDRKDSIEFKLFLDEDEETPEASKGDWVFLRGQVRIDTYGGTRDQTIFASDINQTSPLIREDTADTKRVELHCHSSMSQMDGLFDVDKIVERAAYWDHPAIAVTDHGVAHSFPEAAHAGDEYGVKVIFGVEGYLVQDDRPLVLNVSDIPSDTPLTEEFVVLDCATTGLNPRTDSIFHVSCLKIKDNEITDQFTRIISDREIPESLLEHTHLSHDDVANGKPEDEVFAELDAFLDNHVIVNFEADSTRHFLEEQGISLNQPVVHLRRVVENQWDPPNSDLETLVVNRLNEKMDHRLNAKSGANHSLNVFQEIIHDLPDPVTVETFNVLQDEVDAKGPTNHIILLATNKTGLKNLYRLISKSHLDNFYKNPRILRSEIDEHRVGLLVGSACEAGEIFQSVLHGETDEEVKKRMEFYDLIEVQPVENNKFMLNRGGSFRNITSEDDLQNLTKRIYELGNEMDKPVVGTGDAHFVDPEDEVFRRILQDGQDFEDADNQPPLYIRTTDEMIDRFNFLGEEGALEVAVENPNKVAEMCEKIDPIPDGFHPPKVEDAEQIFRERTHARCTDIYGEDFPDPVKQRLESEAEKIISHQFSNLYVMAAKLVDKSHEDGYLVGSRGSVGSSFTAYLMDITEVNPLPPHYYCRECQYSDFPDEPGVDCGIDLQPKPCPDCGESLKRDGFNIPFEVFCGFEGEKIPDIDLNFSGEYQQEMFDYVMELFGEENVFRAGTIDTIADKTAGGFVDSYLDDRGVQKRRAEVERLKDGLTGVKQNTSQHPGGMIIVPEDKSIHDFSPVNYPANDDTSRFQTTHFDYHAMEDQLVKLDVLGHDDPTQLRHLQEITGINPVDIPLDDDDTMKLFHDISVLDLDGSELDMETGVLGVPEFNTNFVRRIVEETRPATFADLTRISGLSHGEQVWQGNARDLIQNEVTDLTGVISCRDDIMNRLIEHGMPDHMAFEIMEDVRKGRELSDDQIKKMKAHNVPDWYIKSCERISYLFPKAHAVAYVIMAFRIAYYKVHHPTAFYTSYLTLKTDLIDARYVTSKEQVEARMDELDLKINRREATNRDKQEYSVLEVIKEAYLRGVSITPPNISSSRPHEFFIEEESKLRSPYVTVDGLGGTVAETLEQALESKPFSSIEDAKNRTNLNKAIVENAREYGFFDGIPENEHYDLFD